MGYREYCTIFEFVADSSLNQVICLQIDRGRSFIQYQNFRFPQQRSPQADQLSLSHAQVLSTLGYLVHKTTRQI